eukprot:g31511.t1
MYLLSNLELSFYVACCLAARALGYRHRLLGLRKLALLLVNEQQGQVVDGTQRVVVLGPVRLLHTLQCPEVQRLGLRHLPCWAGKRSS